MGVVVGFFPMSAHQMGSSGQISRSGCLPAPHKTKIAPDQLAPGQRQETIYPKRGLDSHGGAGTDEKISRVPRNLLGYETSSWYQRSLKYTELTPKQRKNVRHHCSEHLQEQVLREAQQRHRQAGCTRDRNESRSRKELAAQGVEENPGPNDPPVDTSKLDVLTGMSSLCPNAGTRIYGEAAKRPHGKGKIYHCPLCSMQLSGKAGNHVLRFHPFTRISSSTEEPIEHETASAPRLHIERPVRPPPPSPSEPEFALPNANPIPTAPPLSLHVEEHVSPQRDQDHPVPPPVPVQNNSAPPPVPPQNNPLPIPPPQPPSVATTKKVDHVVHTLSGIEVDCFAGAEILGSMCGSSVEEASVTIDKRTFAYNSENRLVCNRSVEPVKAPIDLVEISSNFHVTRYSIMAHTYYLLGAVLALAVAFTVSAILVDHLCPDTLWGFSLPTVLFSFSLSAVSVAAAIVLYIFCNRIHEFPVVTYCPHLVSCVVQEYDRGTNAASVRSTIRQRIRRLASLPLPDHSALPIIAGSELVAIWVIEHEPFFWARAACFRQPR